MSRGSWLHPAGFQEAHPIKCWVIRGQIVGQRPGGVDRGLWLRPSTAGPDRQLARDDAVDLARGQTRQVVRCSHAQGQQRQVAVAVATHQVGAQRAPGQLVALARAGQLDVGARGSDLVAAWRDAVSVAHALRRGGGGAQRLAAQRGPDTDRIAVVVDRSRLDRPGDRPFRQASIVVGVVHAARDHNVNADHVGGRAAGVGDKGAQRLVLQQLLPADFDAGRNLGRKQRDRLPRLHRLILDLLEAGDGRVFNADRLDVVPALADHMQLVQVLLVAAELDVGLRVKVWVDQMAAVDHGNRSTQAGLVAARELSDTPAYNRWADGTLASNSLGAFNEPGRSAAWPYVIVVLLLSVALLAQLMLHFKTELVQRYPSMRGVFESLAVNLPLPRNSDLVTIESSDLQSDNARGLLVLQATLHNRAPYDQAWPALELTLTDTQDVVLSRRVLAVDDYLPSISKQPAFPANVEYPIRLWIEAKELGAAGYRLYVFYP